MAIQLATAPPCGNAAALMVHPRPGCEAWTLLRRSDDAFTGYDDPNAITVALERDDEMVQVLDWTGLTNGVPVYYQLYCDDGIAWTESGPSVSVTPAYQPQTEFHSPDPAATIRDRVKCGMDAELAAGHLSHESGEIPVLSAPPLIDSVRFPVVTVMLNDRRTEVRGIGESLVSDYFDAFNDIWQCAEGWLDRSEVQCAVWALNPDDRIRLRDALQRVLMINLPIFDAAGFLQIDITQADSNDYESFGAPVYQSIFTLSCLHPAVAREQVGPIRHVEVYPNAQAE